MPIIGTAGHVDHGKSTLIRALTGRDPDRWAEEKERGLTIDLGFAWADLGSGSEVGFVDVPGHERFIKNMLAGVGALDVSLFVVAADEGWMPQSEEHMSILDLLEVGHGVIALTRIDVADPEIVEIAQLEIDELIAGTTLEDWPIVPVSAATGDGMNTLREALTAALRHAGPPPDRGTPRLWVDRSFVISGAGTVVTGTLAGGTLGLGDRVLVLPARTEARIRGIQSHETSRDRIGPGSRVAINLTGVDKDEVPRGALLAGPDDLVLSRRVLATLRSVRALAKPPSERGSYHLHIGTATVPARLKILDDAMPTATILLDLEGHIPASVGDRFILRDTGRRAVVGGGRIVDPFPRRRTSAGDAAALVDALSGTGDDRATTLLAVHGRLDVDRLRSATGGGVPADSVVAGSTVLSPQWVLDQTRSLERITRDFQTRHPLRPGIAKAELGSRARCDRAELEALIVATNGRLVDAGATVHTPDFGTSLSSADERAWTRARPMLAESLAVPRASQLGLSDELTHALVRNGDLIRVASDLVYLPEQIDQITTELAQLDDGFTVAQFRDEFGLSRRQAVPLLEWLDGAGWTIRRGDVRGVRKSQP